MKKSYSMKWIAVFAVLASMSLALYYFSKSKSFSSSGKTRVSKVEKGELVQRVTVAGTVIPNRKTLITAPYSGYVKQLFVKIGDQLKKSDPIISVVQSLQSVDPVFPLRAPFSGTVVQINKTEGEYVKEGDPNEFMVRIDDLTRLFVLANSPEIDLVKFKEGLEAVIRASAILDRSYKGVIRETSLAAMAQERWNTQVVFPIKIEITDADQQIKPGMSAVIDVITNKKTDVLVLRHEFIEKDNEEYFVTLTNGERRKIDVGIQNEEACEIKSGLREGDEIKQVDFLKLLDK